MIQLIFDLLLFFSSSLNIFRCAIPECESINATIYDQNWLSHAIPFKNGRPEKCSRYGATHQLATDEQCPKFLFNESNVIGCNEFVFKTDEYRIIREVMQLIQIASIRLCSIIKTIDVQYNFSLVFYVMKTSINWRWLAL